MHYALNYYGAPEKSDRLFGERRSSEASESPCKQICHDTGARDTELVTTTERSDPKLFIIHYQLFIKKQFHSKNCETVFSFYSYTVQMSSDFL